MASPDDRSDSGNALGMPAAIGLVILAWVSFQLAFAKPSLSWLMFVFLWCIYRLRHVRTARQAFYVTLGLGIAAYGPQLAFFWGVFGAAAIGLWAIAAIWLALFVLLARAVERTFAKRWAAFMMPVLWMGLEYFRSELYYLRFSWLSPGFAFAKTPLLEKCGVYGLGFVLVLLISLIDLLPKGRAIAAAALLAGLAVVTNLPQLTPSAGEPRSVAGPFVVGIQLEGTGDRRVIGCLDAAIAQYPDLDLVVLSEYSFFGPVPADVRAWCREHHKHLIAGGTEPVPGDADQYWNTAYIIGPDGDVLFKQGKSVPIQFFRDGLPAPSQSVWNSPWGRIGLCICYDLSYSRVTDRLIRLGAEALIVPTMDVKSWGAHEHALHSRIGPLRAAEYGVPVVRVCSSGISQIVSGSGDLLATAPYPGQGEIVAGRITLKAGHLPPDRYLAPVCVAITAVTALCLCIVHLRAKLTSRPAAQGRTLTRT